jgi:hypothetical protein
VQRELAAVQRKLERATEGGSTREAAFSEGPWRASDYLAQLTDGRLVRIELSDDGRRAWAVRKSGETVALESLAALERDQVYLSFALALASAAGRQGVRLPLLLDEPFVRLDERGTSALAAVLDAFCREGQQVIVFASQPAAIDRLASVGAAVHDLTMLRSWKRELNATSDATEARSITSADAASDERGKPIQSITARARNRVGGKRAKTSRTKNRGGRSTKPDGRDAA